MLRYITAIVLICGASPLLGADPQADVELTGGGNLVQVDTGNPATLSFSLDIYVWPGGDYVGPWAKSAETRIRIDPDMDSDGLPDATPDNDGDGVFDGVSGVLRIDGISTNPGPPAEEPSYNAPMFEPLVDGFALPVPLGPLDDNGAATGGNARSGPNRIGAVVKDGQDSAAVIWDRQYMATIECSVETTAPAGRYVISAEDVFFTVTDYMTDWTIAGVAGSGRVVVEVTSSGVEIASWTSVRTHDNGIGTMGIVLDPSATGTLAGTIGVTTECRNGGIQLIEVGLNSAITVADITEPIVATDLNGVGPTATATVTLGGGGTILALAFGAGVIPDASCYTIDLAANIAGLIGDTDVEFRTVSGDGNNNGSVDIGDLAAPNSFRLTAAAVDITNFRFDYNVTGTFDIGDIALANAGRLAGRGSSCP